MHGNLYPYKCWGREEALDKLALGKERQLLLQQSTGVPPLLERNRTIQLGPTKLCYRGCLDMVITPRIPKIQLNTQLWLTAAKAPTIVMAPLSLQAFLLQEIPIRDPFTTQNCNIKAT